MYYVNIYDKLGYVKTVAQYKNYWEARNEAEYLNWCSSNTVDGVIRQWLTGGTEYDVTTGNGYPVRY